MLTFDFTMDDLARTRFAISPMWELVSGLRLLRDPDRIGPHLPWLRDALPLAREMQLGAALALTPSRGYIPDFLTPPASSPVASFDDELEQVRNTPAELVRGDIAKLYDRRRPPAAVREVLDDPPRALDRMADALGVWWARALEPHWPRIRSLLDADLMYRAQRLTEGGPSALFDDLERATVWRGDRLEIGIEHDGRTALEGRGLLIVPSAFSWQRAGAMTGEPWQPTLFYPARGLELLWEPGTHAPDALASVLGRSRANLIESLEAPRSTTELARRLELSAGAVSQHLSALRAAGLVTSTRRGREVLYLRTDLADRLRATPAA